MIHGRQRLTTPYHAAAADPAVRELQALGEVSVGVCSPWEFVEL